MRQPSVSCALAASPGRPTWAQLKPKPAMSTGGLDDSPPPVGVRGELVDVGSLSSEPVRASLALRSLPDKALQAAGRNASAVPRTRPSSLESGVREGAVTEPPVLWLPSHSGSAVRKANLKARAPRWYLCHNRSIRKIYLA